MPSTAAHGTSLNLEQLWGEACDELDAAQRRLSLLQLARRVGRLDLPRMLSWVEVLEDAELRFELRRELLPRWGRSDGAGAISWTLNLAGSEHPLDLVASILTEWATFDVEAATKWFAQVAEAGWLEPTTTRALVAVLGQQTPERILELMHLVAVDSARDALCEALVQQWKKQRPADASDVILALTTSQMQIDLLGQVLPQWSQSNWQGALQWVKALRGGPTQAAALIHISYS